MILTKIADFVSLNNLFVLLSLVVLVYQTLGTRKMPFSRCARLFLLSYSCSIFSLVGLLEMDQEPFTRSASSSAHSFSFSQRMAIAESPAGGMLKLPLK